VALDYLAEVSEQLLPEHEPNDRFFRLLLVALDHLRSRGAEGLWAAVTYFSLWAVKLGGWLPDLEACATCGVEMPEGERAWFTRSLPGLVCGKCRPSNAWGLTPESRALAREMLGAPLRRLAPRSWDRRTAADLRQFLTQRLEDHLERKLVTVPLLAEL